MYIASKLEIETTSFRDALAQKQANFQVVSKPVFFKGNEGQDLIIPHSKAIVRADNERGLSVMGSRYEILQNDSCADTFDDIVGRLGAKYTHAGFFGAGQRVFVQATLPDYISAGKDDAVQKMLTFINSHNGTTNLMAGFSDIRIVCLNSFLMALKDVRRYVNVRHNSNAQLNLESVKEILEGSITYFNAVEIKVSQLVNTKVSDAQMQEVLKKVFKTESVEGDDVAKQTQRSIDTVLGHFQSGIGINETNRGTAWSAFNALTQYSDWDKRVKKEESNPMGRVESNLLGSSAQFKDRALIALDSVLGL